ncbi:flagellar biosynthetic protein FliO [Natronospirillum operosum]|uniref:Flagellar protein n=1 Tax=Natronospirillum operosum TaxID=2759953 RepID=A0A4Z0WJI9_9GAMM|nr:flagellar biosynthetic protein FliO [Natronospirillum operosum]TGG95967.1 flagellar biosynthetic protein FliO [Natronospirillum operosum]
MRQQAKSLLAGLTMAAPGLAAASGQRAPASPVGVSAGDMVTVILGLLVVIGLIFAFAWVVRRFNGSTTVNGRAIKVLAVTPLGAKEKLVLVAVGQQQLLLGVTAHQVTRLLELEEPLDLTAHPEGSPFARQLGALLGGKQADLSPHRKN